MCDTVTKFYDEAQFKQFDSVHLWNKITIHQGVWMEPRDWPTRVFKHAGLSQHAPVTPDGHTLSIHTVSCLPALYKSEHFRGFKVSHFSVFEHK